MKQKRSIKRFFIIGLLSITLIAMLGAYSAVVSDLPNRIYSTAQLAFLQRNALRSVSQIAPMLNFIGADGIVDLITLPWRTSRVRAHLTAHYEELEDISATVYDLDFQGEYQLLQPGSERATVELFFPFPDNLETLHEVRFLVDGKEPLDVQYSIEGIRWVTELEAGEEHQVKIGYKADGVNTFSYLLPYNQRSDVDVTITVVGLTGATVPRTSLQPTATEVGNSSETITWAYTNLIPDRNIQLNLPTQLSFAQRVALLQDDFRSLASVAPLLIGLCLLSLAAVFHLSQVRLQIENYLLLGCALALFYPLLTFISGLVDVKVAAASSLLIITGLSLLFLKPAMDRARTLWRAALVMLTFLGIFSLGLLTPWRGMLLTGGGVLLLGILMLLYARRPITPEPEAILPIDEPEAKPEPVLSKEITDVSPTYHCPYCARQLEQEYQYCPNCGHGADQVQHCARCGHEQFIPTELERVYCLHCGEEYLSE